MKYPSLSKTPDLCVFIHIKCTNKVTKKKKNLLILYRLFSNVNLNENFFCENVQEVEDFENQTVEWLYYITYIYIYV